VNYPGRPVVDTNVLVVANGQAPHVSTQCTIEAVRFLDHARRRSIIVLDSGGEIFNEYKRHCSFKGQPGAGDRFFLHLHQTQADKRRVERVDIHPLQNGSYKEVPTPLAQFDLDDHKFIATVIADGRRSKIVNCADSDWKNAESALTACGIQLVELCSSEAPVA
jgi:hypothetical protein